MFGAVAYGIEERSDPSILSILYNFYSLYLYISVLDRSFISYVTEILVLLRTVFSLHEKELDKLEQIFPKLNTLEISVFKTQPYFVVTTVEKRNICPLYNFARLLYYCY